MLAAANARASPDDFEAEMHGLMISNCLGLVSCASAKDLWPSFDHHYECIDKVYEHEAIQLFRKFYARSNQNGESPSNAFFLFFLPAFVSCINVGCSTGCKAKEGQGCRSVRGGR